MSFKVVSIVALSHDALVQIPITSLWAVIARHVIDKTAYVSTPVYTSDV